MRRLALAALIAAAAFAAPAQDYPARTVKLIIPFPPGGTTDLVGRVFAEHLAKALGKPVVVENRGGGGGSLGADAIAKSPPDGYTLGMSTVSALAVNPACNPRVGYDPVRDFRAITRLASSPHVILVNPAFPARDFAAFRELVAANPGRYSFANSGTCGTGHMLGEQLQHYAKLRLVHVPYRGAGPALNDVLANHVPILVDGLPSSLAHIRAGRLRPLVIAAEARSGSVPDVPTFAEAGLPEINDPSWYGLVAPAGTPDEVIRVVHAAAVRALKDPGLVERYQAAGAAPGGNTPEQHAAEVKASFERMKAVVAARGIRPE